MSVHWSLSTKPPESLCFSHAFRGYRRTLAGWNGLIWLSFNSFMTEFLSYRNQLLICRANQWTGFYMKGTSVMKESGFYQICKNILSQETCCNKIAREQATKIFSIKITGFCYSYFTVRVTTYDLFKKI